MLEEWRTESNEALLHTLDNQFQFSAQSPVYSIILSTIHGKQKRT